MYEARQSRRDAQPFRRSCSGLSSVDPPYRLDPGGELQNVRSVGLVFCLETFPVLFRRRSTLVGRIRMEKHERLDFGRSLPCRGLASLQPFPVDLPFWFDSGREVCSWCLVAGCFRVRASLMQFFPR